MVLQDLLPDGDRMFEQILTLQRLTGILSLCVFSLSTVAQTTVSGTISTDTTWSGLIHVTGDVTVSSGYTLTIDPGTVIKFDAARSLSCSGILLSNGTLAQPVVFTSIADDTFGGDTNGDGTDTSPSAGSWNQVSINSTGSGTLTHTSILYAGASYSAFRFQGTSLTVDNLLISDTNRAGFEVSGSVAGAAFLSDITLKSIGTSTAHHGLYILNNNATVDVRNLTVTDVAGTHVVVRNAGKWSSSGTSLSGSGLRAINIQGGIIEDERTWGEGVAYYLTSAVTINAGGKLVLPAGTIVKGGSNGAWAVNGAMEINGTSGQPVILTSIKDDTVGGDTNDDGGATTPAPGDWHRILMGQGATVLATYADLRYGGKSSSEYFRTSRHALLTLLDSSLTFGDGDGVFVPDGNATIMRNTFSDLGDHGVDIASSADSVKLIGNSFTRAQIGAYSFSAQVGLNASGNTISDCGRANAIRVADSSVSQTQSWTDPYPYFLDAGLQIQAGSTLTLPPGTILKMDVGSSIQVIGTLNAHSTSGNRTVVTSVKDDTAGGDTNGDAAATAPAPGDWRYIQANNTSHFPELMTDYWEVRYAGNSSSPAIDLGTTGGAVMRHMIIRDVANAGILVRNSRAPTDFSGTQIQNAGSYGVEISAYEPEFLIDLSNMNIDTSANAGLRLQARSSFDITGLTMANTARDGAVLIASSGSMDGNHQFAGGFTYFMETDISVGQSGSLTIGPGAVLKFGQYDGIQVDGALTVNGTEAEPVLFTTWKDDTGGDSNEDGTATSPVPGDWFSLWIRDTYLSVVNLTTPAQNFFKTVDTFNGDGSPLRVEVTGTLDRDTRTVTVSFQSIDPDTGLPPLGTFDGFLQVEAGDGTGQGFFAFTVHPVPGQPTGTEIRNLAEIVFDTNDVIPTPETLHTLDAEPGTTAVNPLPTEVVGPTFTLSLNGNDGDGAGIAWWDIYVAENGGDFSFWGSTASNTAEFTGTIGSSYEFYSVGTDKVGHVEPKVPTTEAQTSVVAAIILQQSIEVSPGWHALSVPFIPVDPSLAVVLDTGVRGNIHVGEVWGYEPESGTSGQHKSLSQATALQGFWVYFPTGATLQIEGTEVANEVSLNTGYNFVGPAVSCAAPYDDDRLAHPIMEWVPGRNTWRAVPHDGQLVPGQAYLFYAKEPFVLDFSAYE